MNGRQSFTPYEFLDRLKRDEIRRPVVLSGMVKPAEDDDDYLLFAHGSVCENWIRIRLNSIETIEFLNFVPCDDHTHPLVLLVLKQPETDEGQLFAALVQAASGRIDKRDVGFLCVLPPGSLQYMAAHIGTNNAGGREPLGERSRFLTGGTTE